MDKNILLDPAVQAFIASHKNDDPANLMLKRDKFQDWPFRDIVDQIISRRKAEKKLTTWYNTSNILFPSPLSVEQSSSEITAAYKASLFEGQKAIDLTGGLGVDSYYLAKQFAQLIYVEKNIGLAEIAAHNFSVLEQNNIEVINSSAEEYLKGSKGNYDLIYIDPDRRPDEKRVTAFSDSTPDVVKLLPKLQTRSKNILVKASPMTDIHESVRKLGTVSNIIVLANDNELKEVLFLLRKEAGSTKVRCVNIKESAVELLEYDHNINSQEVIEISPLSNYLYEPNVAIMKAGGFSSLASLYKVKKLHPNTHLFTSNQLVKDFPGRKFKVLETSNYKKGEVQKILHENKVNVSVRNFADSPDQLKKKLGLQDGGNQYLFGYKDLENRYKIAICEKC